jgi:DNA polymerase III subunit alpha
MSFVNLHGHSHYSLLDGYGSPTKIVKRAKELGYPAAALTDHGVTYGLIELYKAGKKEGIKPILGCEFYVAPRTRFDKEAKVDIKPYHLTILARNNEGYSNILKMTSKAHLEGFYYKPRVDYDLLREHSEGLIVLSGCLAAHLPRMILSGDQAEIKRVLELHIELFGKENYYLELQDNPLLEMQSTVNEGLKKLAKEYDLPMVLTFDSHYPRPEDKDAHDVLLCIQTGSTVSDENRMRYTGDFSLRDVEELRPSFADCPGIFENTVKIAERCNVELEFGKHLIPAYETPDGLDSPAYLRQLCLEGLKKRLDGKDIPEDYMKRLDYELETVRSMGFDTYFLIVQDFVNFARNEGIVVGPGRGSAAGAIIAWSLYITDLDPIAHGLFFERFLNPERISMPDIDIDFADNKRELVLNYVIDKYGADKVAQIITFGTMAPKAAIRDTGRALGYPYAEVDALSKAVPPANLGKYAPLVESIKDDPELSRIYNKDPRAKVLLDYAKRLEGTVRHVGTHACAVVISEKPLTEYTALQNGAGGGGEIITQYDAKPLEDLGLLKMDFLGLRNLTIIQRCEELVLETRGETVDVSDIAMDDKKTFELLQKADTTGVFQLESGGMRRYLKELKPTIFEDIVAMGALYRPGPMEWIPSYIKGKHNPEKVKYHHPSFKKILASTYGVAVYQEQILELARDFAGYSLGEADILRKAVGKKIPSLLAEQRNKFVEGAVANGHKKKSAEEVFSKVIEPFAGYGFNKAHAACYGMIAYQTAYLKAHYPIEFMTAMLCSDAGNTERVVLEIKECAEMNIEVLSPSINESFADFMVVGKSSIRFGLMAIKGIGDGPISEIMEARSRGGEFKSIEDFATRIPAKIVNKKLVQALAYSGAFDIFGDRNQIAENYDSISKFAKQSQDSANSGQTDIFGVLGSEETGGKLNFRAVPLATDMQKLKWEKELLGMYVTGHPLRGLRRYIGNKAQLIVNINEKKLNKPVRLMGMVSELRRIMTKNGSYMATFMIEDPSAKVSAVMFPRTFAQYGERLVDDQVASFNGKFDNRRGSYQFVCDATKGLSLPIMIENAKEASMYEPDDKSDIAIRLIDDILADVTALDEDGFPINPEESDRETNKDFMIRIPKGSKAETMKNLKILLVENPGETFIEVFVEAVGKKIKLPFGVKLDDELKSKINTLLTS